jgi:hypothetical protein
MFAFLPRLFNKFFPHVEKSESRRREDRYVRPQLEELEGRIVPDAYTWAPQPGSTDYTNKLNWFDNTNPAHIAVPGSTDTAFIGGTCVLNSTTQQAVAGLTVGGTFSLASKLSVTTLNSPGTFNINPNGELNVLASADFGGGGTVNGRIDAGAASVTFDPFSNMVLAIGTSLTGGGVFNIDGTLTWNTAINPEATLALNNDGNLTFGQLLGTGSLDEWHEFDWSGGQLGLSGGITLEPTSDFKMQGANNKELTTGTVTSIAQLA